MNVLFAIKQHFPYSGLQQDFLRMAVTCARRGARVVCLCLDWEGPRPNELEIRLVQEGESLADAFRRVSAELRPVRTVSFALSTGANADFHFAGFDCLKLLAEKGLPDPVSMRSVSCDDLADEAAIFSERASTKIFFLTNDQKEQFARAYGLGDERFLYLPPGMNPECGRVTNPDAARAAKRSEFGVRDDETLILLAAHDFQVKGADRLLRSFADLPTALRSKTKLFLTGFLWRTECEALARELGIADRVRFDGGRTDLPQILCAADLMVHPARREAAGSILVEAIASGLPVLCSGVCGFRNFVEDASGIVLPEPFRQSALTDALQTLLENPADLAQRRAKTLNLAAKTDFTRRADVAADFILNDDRQDLQEKSHDRQDA